MNRALGYLGIAGLGAAGMYLLDPTWGARRRGSVRDKLVHGANRSSEGVAAAARDLSHRMEGLLAETRARLGREAVPDEVLVARVRSALGRACSHPHAIEVAARDGRVTLRGPVLAAEAKKLPSFVRSVRGVTEVVDEMDVHEQPGNIPALQGGASRMRQGTWLQDNWSPAMRLAAGGAGAALLGYCMVRREPSTTWLGFIGTGLLVRAGSNMDWSRLTGIGAGRRAVELQKTMSINAPVKDVYRFFARYEDFPQYTSHVREVRPTRIAGQSHWVVELPGGVPLQFDAVETRRVDNVLLAWRSVEGAQVQHAGIMQFEPEAEGATRVHLRFSYNPPAGALGHAIAKLIGTDAKSLLDEEFVRIKTAIETGRKPHDAAQHTSS